MSSPIRTARLLLAPICVCLALMAGPLGRSQAAPTAAPQDTNGLRYPLDTDGKPYPLGSHGQPYVPNMNAYDPFIRTLGEEDNCIQKTAPGGIAQAPGRRDYAAAIGIGKNEEQMMLTTVLDGYHREKAKDDQLWEDKWRLTHQVENPEQGLKTWYAEKEPVRKEKFAILTETWTKLRDELGEESFKKLDAYVNSRAWSTEVRIPGFGQIAEPAVKMPGWSHMAYPGAYGDFFDDIRSVEVNNRGAIEDGRETMPYSLPFGLGPIPEDKKQAVIAIALEAAQEMNESNEQYISAAHEFYNQNEEKYGLKVYTMPLPPEIDALRMKVKTIIDEETDKLRQVLGEEYFKRFDEELSRSNRSRENTRHDTGKPSCPASPAAPRQSADSPAPAAEQYR